MPGGAPCRAPAAGSGRHSSTLAEAAGRAGILTTGLSPGARSMAEIQRIGNVYFVVHDVEEAVRFYRDVLGLKQKFRDGDRWVAFDVGGTTLAVAGPEEAPLIGGTGPFVSLRTDDLDG